MCKAYIDAYMAFQDKKHLESALKNALFLTENQLQQDGSLMHSYKNGQSTIICPTRDVTHRIYAL